MNLIPKWSTGGVWTSPSAAPSLRSSLSSARIALAMIVPIVVGRRRAPTALSARRGCVKERRSELLALKNGVEPRWRHR